MLFFFKRNRKKIQRRTAKKEVTVARHIVYGVVSILCVVLLCVLVWYVTRHEAVTISEVTIVGGETISHDTVRSLVEQELKGSYVLLIPHRFTYLYPHDAIQTALEEVPRIHSVSIEKKSRVALEVSFSEFMPQALWCLSEESVSSCYFMNQDGYAFAPAPPLRGGALMRHVVEGVENLSQTQVVEAEQIHEVYAFVSRLEEGMDFRTNEIIYRESGDIVFQINGGGTLLTSGTMTSENTYENLLAILNSEEFNHLEPGNFNYIDLRFGNKVFVNEELEVSSLSTTTDEVDETELE